MIHFPEYENNIPSGTLRTRFAPSPTGYMHIGGVRTALYTYLLARQAGGKFLLRIEDTDKKREVGGAVEIIYSSLRIAGISWDEGPDVGGPSAPYTQSERLPIYKKYAEKLVELGGAYYDPDGSGAIRQRIPHEGSTTFHDEIFGDITVANDSASMNEGVLLKSDGYPTYNFANVIDDHLMGITHVVRGSEYLSSDAKFDLLYHSYGWEIPKYVTVSPVMRDAQHKISKREGDSTFEDLLNEGYLPEAVVNYVALCGWSPGGKREFYTVPELIDIFDLKGISKSPSIFDRQKLRYFNAEYIKRLDAESFAEISKPFIEPVISRAAENGISLNPAAVAELVKSRTELLGEIPAAVAFLPALPEFDAALFYHAKSGTDSEVSLKVIRLFLDAANSLDTWSRDALYEAQVELAKSLEAKNALVMYPVRIAVSGTAVTPGGAAEIAAVLGKNETQKRLNLAIKKLEMDLNI